MKKALGIIMILIGVLLGLSVLNSLTHFPSFRMSTPEELGRICGHVAAMLLFGLGSVALIRYGVKFVQQKYEE